MKDPEVGHLYVFIDENQALYKRHGNLPVDDEPFYLTANCRNTAPIHRAAYKFYQGEPVDAPDLTGPDVEKVAKDSDVAQAEYIAQRLHQLISREQLKPADIAVLVAKREKWTHYAALRRAAANMGGPRLSFEEHGKSNAVLVETVARFKGLESAAVILWIGDEVVENQEWETVYVGISRAKSLLIVVGSSAARF